MYIGLCYDKEIRGEFSYSSLFEMLASMHVIVKPEHHLDRTHWIQKVMDDLPEELIEAIRNLGDITDEWLIIMDFTHESPYADLSIPDVLAELDKLDLSRWSELFRHYNKSITQEEKNHIVSVMKEYYELLFQYEIAYLQPFLIRIMRKELERCKEEGLLQRINQYHQRLIADHKNIIFLKNKEYRYNPAELNKIVVRASTFISPHLLMHEEMGTLYITMLVAVEEKKDIVPSDLTSLLKALSDETRLQILHAIHKKPASTQSLAIRLKITEAGISKHLRILHNAGLVSKKRQGNYILYQLEKTAVDFLPYRLYEYILR